MSSPEAHAQEQPLSTEQQRVWRSLVEKAALRSLRMLEALYLSEQEQEARKDAPLTSARYQQWLAWMEKMDADPNIPFKQHHFVDEVVLVQNIKAFTRAMEALEELRTRGRVSPSTQENLGFPKIFQHISPEKLTLFSLTIGGKTPQQLEAELEARGFGISPEARFMMRSKGFTTEQQEEQITLVCIKVDDLFYDGQQHTTEQLFSRAKELGLEACPAEVGPCLRLTYKDQPLYEWVNVAMKQITPPDRDPSVFGVERNDNGSWLSDRWAPPDGNWGAGYEFVVRLPAPSRT
mgnify:FL=1